MHKTANLPASGSMITLMVASTSVALYLLNTTENFQKAQEMAVTSQLAFLGAAAAFVLLLVSLLDQIKTPLKFIYSCFLKPLSKNGDISTPQGRLEAFYKDQAESKLDFVLVGPSIPLRLRLPFPLFLLYFCHIYLSFGAILHLLRSFPLF
jgi:hypothetical protein